MKTMKHLWLGCLILLASAEARADDRENGATFRRLGNSLARAWVQFGDVWWITDSENLVSPSCKDDVAELTRARVPDSETFILSKGARDLASGRHTFAEAKANCNQIAYVSRVKAFTLEVKQALEAGDAAGGKRCAATLKAGIKPTERVAHQILYIKGDEVTFRGTIDELRRTFCDPLVAKR